MSHDATLPAWIAGGEGFRAFAGRLADAVLCKDLECRFLYANDAALRALDLFGGPPPIGHRLSELCPIAESSRIEQSDLAAMASGETTVTHEHFVAAAQRRRYLVTRIALRDASGTVCGVVCLWVEERRHGPVLSKIDADPAHVSATAGARATTRALETPDPVATERAARAQAERAAAARDQFMGIVAHDLRSPLTGIQSWASVLEAQLQSMPDPPVLASRAIQGIKNGVEQQVQLIEQLLETTRILSGTVALSIADVALAPILTSVVYAQKEAASARGIRIGVNLAPGEAASALIRADAARVEQFVRLLVSAALRRWPPAHTVEVALALDEVGTVHLRVSEASTSAADLAAATKAVPASAPGQRRADDTEAMDLALARRLIELQGGEMDESAPGRKRAIDVRFPRVPEGG